MLRRLLLLLAAMLLLGAGPCDPPCGLDSDADGVCELNDVCPGADDGVDTDGDGLPDACDACPSTPGGDADGDGTCDAIDPCPLDSPDDADENEHCDVEDRYALDDLLTLDDVQVRGTHNSYHVQPAIPFAPSHRYTQPPLGEQLALWGVRSFELDLHRHTNGFRVYHLSGIDEKSTCNALVACLEEMRDYSDANRHHLPMLIWLEPKSDGGGKLITELDSVDTLLRGVFGDDRIVSPDDVRGGFPTLREAIETTGWPSLAEVRGKVLVMLLDDDSLASNYRDGAPSLEGRVMFTRAEASDHGAPWAAVAKINDPGATSEIASAHGAGILVASNTCGAEDDDPDCDARLVKGLASGVQMLMDDIPAPVDDRAYFLDLPDGDLARCNEVTAPPSCSSADLE